MGGLVRIQRRQFGEQRTGHRPGPRSIQQEIPRKLAKERMPPKRSYLFDIDLYVTQIRETVANLEEWCL